MLPRMIRVVGVLAVLLAPKYVFAASPLFARGYTVLPSPQKVQLGTKDFTFTHAWRLELGAGLKPDDIAVTDLRERLQERFQLKRDGS